MDKWIEINLGAVRGNVRKIKEKLSPSAFLTAVVKADGYGHGAAEIAGVAVEEGAYALGVFGIDEAVALRNAGIKGLIFLLRPQLPGDAAEIVRNRLIPAADSVDFIAALNKAAGKYFYRKSSMSSRFPLYPYHLDIDFGLGRWGINPSETKNFLCSAGKFRNVRLGGVSTHLDYVPGKNAVEAEEKLLKFKRCCGTVKSFYPDAVCHAANSSIFMDFPHWHMDMARIGNLMYGIHPAAAHGQPVKAELAGFKNPWKFRAKIISVKTVSKGVSIGYASEYIAPKRMKIAAVAAGYSDGITMEPAERFIRLGGAFQYWGMIRGRQAPFIGRCAISHTLLDVTKVPGAKAGDIVQLPLRRTAASRGIPRIYIR